MNPGTSCLSCKHFAPHFGEVVPKSVDEGRVGRWMGSSADNDSQALWERRRSDQLLPGDRPALECWFDGYCMLAEMPVEDEDVALKAPHMLVCAVDGEGYRGSVLVKEDFGCRCWEPKSGEG